MRFRKYYAINLIKDDKYQPVKYHDTTKTGVVAITFTQ